MTQRAGQKSSLAIGGVAAILASACCLGPLILVGIGLSGAWTLAVAGMTCPTCPITISKALTKVAVP